MPRIRIEGLEQRVDEGCDRGALGQHHQPAEHHHHDQGRQQPEFLPRPHKPPKLSYEIHYDSLVVIARSEATKQSILSLLGDMDCFAALAMTVSKPAISLAAFSLML